MVWEHTNTVTNQEAHEKRIGKIRFHLKFQNGMADKITSITETLIHPRLVLTCAHFLHTEYMGCRSVIIDKNFNPNINHGIEFNIDDKSDSLIVKNILDSSPFQNIGLEIGDVIQKIQCTNMSTAEHVTVNQTSDEISASDFQQKIDSLFHKSNESAQFIWELYILRPGVSVKFSTLMIET